MDLPATALRELARNVDGGITLSARERELLLDRVREAFSRLPDDRLIDLAEQLERHQPAKPGG